MKYERDTILLFFHQIACALMLSGIPDYGWIEFFAFLYLILLPSTMYEIYYRAYNMHWRD